MLAYAFRIPKLRFMERSFDSRARFDYWLQIDFRYFRDISLAFHIWHTVSRIGPARRNFILYFLMPDMMMMFAMLGLIRAARHFRRRACRR